MNSHVIQSNKLPEPTLADPTRNKPSLNFSSLEYKDSWQLAEKAEKVIKCPLVEKTNYEHDGAKNF